MQCQMPGCKNKGIKAITKEGIFLGVHLRNVMVYTCGKHPESEVLVALEKVGEEEASFLQHDCNTFAEARHTLHKTA